MALAYPIIAIFEAKASDESGFGNLVHSGLVARYLLAYSTEQRRRPWLHGMAIGDLIGAIAISEPGAGSDIKAPATCAVQHGDDHVPRDQRFISNVGM